MIWSIRIPLILFVLAILLSSSSPLVAQQKGRAQALPLEHSVTANAVYSSRDPALVIRLPSSAHYVGGTRFVLYGSSNCELHVFVEADAKKTVQRLYWVQFEQYLPTEPALHHNYRFVETAPFGGLSFDVKAQFGRTDDAVKPGSDLEQVQSILRANGYVQPADMMNVRLIYTPDKEQRHELMMIYAENLQPTGHTTGDLLPGGKAESQWATLKMQLLTRALAHIEVQQSATQ